jgi:phage antirepressor YoqD-like protein
MIGIIKVEEISMKENDIDSSDWAVRGRLEKLSGVGDAASVGKTMTVREVAEALGVDDRTIQRIAKKLYPELVRKGATTLLNETQATAIKSEIGKGRTDLDNVVEVGNIKTALDIERMTLQVIEYHRDRIKELEAENRKQQERLAVTEPKAETLDKMTATNSDVSVRELAAILAVPHLGQNNLFERLRKDGYIDGLNRPYRQYIEGGLMYEKEYYVPQLDATKQQLRITQKGVAYFARKYAPSRMGVEE